MQIFQIPVLLSEQNPARLGPTIPEITSLLTDAAPVSKMSFSCCGDKIFMQQLEALNRKQIVISGIETHVCVYQTAVHLVEMGYEVQVVTDAVSSRTLENKQIGLQRMKDCGVILTSVETALFELLGVAEGESFKAILQIVK